MRSAKALKSAILYSARIPIVLFRPFDFDFIEGPIRQLRVGQIDLEIPTGIIKCSDGNTLMMFPITITMGTIPFLQAP
jgi:hypothetical protein